VEAVLGYVSATIEHFQKQGDLGKWKDFWFNEKTKTLYFVGKDNIPFHTIILPALLLASKEGYNLPWNVSSTEFLQFKGEKASKSQRRGIWIDEAIALFPPDYWRYFLMATRPETKDSNFSWAIFREKINSDLNDSFGNFVHRTLTFINTRFSSKIPQPTTLDEQVLTILKDKVAAIANEIEGCKLQSAANTMISISRIGNQYLNDWEPWHLIKKDSRQAGNTIYMATQMVKTLAIVSYPFIPFSAENMWITLNLPGKIGRWQEALTLLPPKHEIAKAKPLFQKISLNEHELEQKLQNVRKRS
jgi:methionyl-tRNA synthetase